MKKLTLNDIKDHFNYCISEGFPIGENEQFLLEHLYKRIENSVTEYEQMNKEFNEDLLEMKYDKQGLNLKLGGQTAMNFMTRLIDLFEVNGGKNFLTITLHKGENKYGITIQNCNGIDTPAEKMQRLEDEIEGLNAELNKLYKTIEKKDQALNLIIKNTVSGHVENIAKKALEN